MYGMFFLVTALAAFPVQLFFCSVGKNKWIRRLPVLLVLGFDIVCAIAAALPFLGQLRNLAAILLISGLWQLVAAGFAWAVWGIVRFVQKMRK